MLGRLARSMVPTQLVRLVRCARPALVNHRLTDTPVVQALRRAADTEAIVAVYDDGGAPHATPETLERELGVILSPTRNLRLPSISAHSFASTRRTIRAVTLTDADPPVVLLSRRSLEDWNEQTRNFVLAHEFGHLSAELPDSSAMTVSANPAASAGAGAAESVLPAPGQSELAVRALVAAHREFRAGEAHAKIRADLPECHRPPASVMAEYHSVERASEKSVVLSSAEQRALAIRNAAKYLPLPYDPPEVGEDVRTALARPLPRYLDWVKE